MLRPKEIREAIRREKYARAHRVVNRFAARFPSAEMSAWAAEAHREIAYAQRFPWWRHEVEARIGEPPVTASAPRAHTKTQKKTIRTRTARRITETALRRALSIASPAEDADYILRAVGFSRVRFVDGTEGDVPYGYISAVSTGRCRVAAPSPSRGVRGHGASEIVYDEVQRYMGVAVGDEEAAERDGG